jgi:hypothetical protein
MTLNRQFGNRDNRGDSNYPQQVRLPVGYLQKGYFDEKGNVFPQVIQEWAKAVSDALFSARPRMTTSQLRGAFFAEARRLEKKLDANHDFDAVRPDILKLSVFAADRRKKNKVSDIFEEFITANLRVIRNEKDFKKGFINHFECVVGLYPEVRGN